MEKPVEPIPYIYRDVQIIKARHREVFIDNLRMLIAFTAFFIGFLLYEIELGFKILASFGFLVLSLCMLFEIDKEFKKIPKNKEQLKSEMEKYNHDLIMYEKHLDEEAIKNDNVSKMKDKISNQVNWLEQVAKRAKNN